MKNLQILIYKVRTLIHRWFEAAPRWATLRTLGQSRLLAFTAFVPFLGSLILFNHQIVEFLEISPRLIAKWTGASEPSSFDIANNFTLGRIQITYFGLCFLGIASFLFTIFCPSEIKRFPDVSAYIVAETPLITNARTGLLVSDVAEDFLMHHGDEEASGPEILRIMAYSNEQAAHFDSVFKTIAETIDWPADEPVPEAERNLQADEGSMRRDEIQSDPIFEMGLLSISGEYLSEKVARVVYYRRRVEKFFWSNFDFAARSSITDLLALRYVALDGSKPTARLIVVSCYGLGFGVLFYPTVWTFVRIIFLLIGIV